MKSVYVPDIGSPNAVSVIEVNIKPGDVIRKNDTIMTLESDKAAMDVPASVGGVVSAVAVKVGDKVKQGDLMYTLEAGDAVAAAPAPLKPEIVKPEPVAQVAPVIQTPVEKPIATSEPTSIGIGVYASPAVRRLARELGVELSNVGGSGRKGRIQISDLHAHVKKRLSGEAVEGSGLPMMPAVDFSQFGEFEIKAIPRIKKLSATFLHRNWVLIPHVTQFDEADITELEAFRDSQKAKAEKQGFKLTPLVFLMKAVVAALKQFPDFNSSLSPDGQQWIFKKYYHIGVAVDTPGGLVVPVIRDVDQKGLFELAKELGALSEKARAGKLTPMEMQGSSFTISSLGGVGGTAFTPIINAPDVAILGVSKSQMKPVYQDGAFVPRLMLPLSLSYDHRVIDGAQAARFSTYLSGLLADLRRVLL
ncbi:MAG: dihydrolipoyllysine-residue acetyltransferase [Gammaproteobacteria bacterium]